MGALGQKVGDFHFVAWAEFGDDKGARGESVFGAQGGEGLGDAARRTSLSLA